MKAQPINLSTAAVFGWIIANAVGFGSQFISSFLPPDLLVQDISLRNPAALANTVPGSLLIGLLLGLAQWLALGRIIPGLPFINWVTATAIGNIIGYIAQCAIFFPLLIRGFFTGEAGFQFAIVGLSLMMGLCMGAFQASVIRSRLPNAGRWIWINVLGQGIGSLALAAPWALLERLHIVGIAGDMALYVGAGVLFGIVTIVGFDLLLNPARTGVGSAEHL